MRSFNGRNTSRSSSAGTRRSTTSSGGSYGTRSYYRGSNGSASSGSGSGGSRFGSSGSAAAPRTAPYGTSRSPRLYSGSYSRSYRGVPDARGSGTNSSSRLSTSGSRSGSTTRFGATGSRRSSGRSVTSFEGARRSASEGYRSADSYRSNLDSRLNGRRTFNPREGSGPLDPGSTRASRSRNDATGRATSRTTNPASPRNGGRSNAENGPASRAGASRGDVGSNGRRAVPGAGGGRIGGDGAASNAGRNPGDRVARGADDVAGRRGDGGVRDGREGRGGRGGRNHHHHDHYRRGNRDFYFFLGGPAYGFGWYGGWGSFGWSYWNCNWWGWGYPSWYCSPYWYPSYGCSWYPYYWSYRWWPRYRSVVYVDSYDPYVSTVYLPSGGFVDDPYVEDDVILYDPKADVAPPPTKAAESATVAPIVEGLDAGADYASCVATGDRFLAENKSLEAAEAYRQAWIKNPSGDALMRMGWALLDGGDYPLASWAFRTQVGNSKDRLIEAATLVNAMLGSERLKAAVDGLERYLVDNPNDEGSNLLLGGLYVLSGREYAGYILLTRLEGAKFEPETTRLLLDEARARLEK